MTNGQFKYLFSPFKIGNITVKNRIIQTAHKILPCREGVTGDQYIEYMRERAKGGVGAIVTEVMSVHPTSDNFPGVPGDVMAFDENVIPQFKKLAHAIHEYDAKIFGQLSHGGRQGNEEITGLPVWAPSAIPDPVIRQMPKEMEIEEINELIEGFAKAAKNVREGGLDGVELYASSAYLIGQFFSPDSNQRKDEFGGSLENRMKFCINVIDRIREVVGSDFVLGIKIGGDELVPGGLTLDDFKEIAKRLEATGKIDYITVTPLVSFVTFQMMGGLGMSAPLGAWVHQSAAMKEVLSHTPIVTNGRIKDPIQAEKILADGHADLIGMARALISDPEFANKAREGRSDDIRTCLSCNLGCFKRVFSSLPGTCIQNAAVGREKEIGIIEPAKTRKKVIVVGGGPGGMEAARVARLRGHRVTLYEKEKELGGQVNLAAKVPSRQEFGDVTRYLGQQVKKLGVEINLAVEVTPEMVKRENADVVIIATGSTPFLPPIPGADQDNVVNVRQVLKDEVKVGENVLLIDDDAHHKAINTAEYLANQGKKVEIVTRLLFVGMDIAASGLLYPIYQNLLSKGVKFTPHTMVIQISGNTVTGLNVYTYGQVNIEGVDTVILATNDLAEDLLYRSLKGQVKELYRVGDCVAPRKVMNAIHEGYNLGRLI
jgi:mycofactocin system FadH/OYE family oxidoreductase 2